MPKRATSPRGNRAAASVEKPTGSPRKLLSSLDPLAADRPSALPSFGSADLRRAVMNWLADGKAQGWSIRTLNDRRHTMDRFLWWLENEAETPATLAALTAAQIRSFLAYTREHRPEGRYGSDHPSAHKEVRPATVNAYYRILRAFVNFLVAEGLLPETPLKNVKAPRIPNEQVQPPADGKHQFNATLLS